MAEIENQPKNENAISEDITDNNSVNQLENSNKDLEISESVQQENIETPRKKKKKKKKKKIEEDKHSLN